MNDPKLYTLAWSVGAVVFMLIASYGLGSLARGVARVSGRSSAVQDRTFAGYFFASPWILGFLIFVVGPALASLYWSFTRYRIGEPITWVGFDNYIRLLTEDDRFRIALLNSGYMTLLGLPIQAAVALGLALLLNRALRGERFFRVIFYLPVILAGSTATLAAWRLMLNPSAGLINSVLDMLRTFPPIDWLTRLVIYLVELSSAAFVSLQRWNGAALNQVLAAGFPDENRVPLWTQSPFWSKPAIILILVWSCGSMMVIYLAALKSIPQRIYEAAAVDGVNGWQRFRHISLPLLTPATFYNLVVGVIATLQIFEQSYVLTANGGPEESTYFVAYYLWRSTFRFNQIGYGAAMSWILLVIILALTALQFWLARRWVNYDLD
jgi:multiple sugar transport system permease protein